MKKVISMCLAVMLILTMFSSNTLETKAWEENVTLTLAESKDGSNLELNILIEQADDSIRDYEIKFYANDIEANFVYYALATETTHEENISIDISDSFSGLVSGEVRVVAKAMKINREIAVSNEVTVTVAEEKLKSVENFRMEGNTIKWDKVEGAAAYQVQLSKKTGKTSYTAVQSPELERVSDTSVDLSSYAGEVTHVRVRALSGDCTSYLHSDPVQVDITSMDSSAGAGDLDKTGGQENVGSSEKTEGKADVAEKGNVTDSEEESSKAAVTENSEKEQSADSKTEDTTDKGKKNFLTALLSNLFIFNLSGCGHQHIWEEATCAAPKTCTECGRTEGETLEHVWEEATCAAPKTCTGCNATEGEALEHTWEEATYVLPKTCSVCNTTEGTSIPVCVSMKDETFNSYEEYEYDEAGNKIKTKNFWLDKRDYEYDVNHNLIGLKSASREEVYEYDANNNRTKRTNYSYGELSSEQSYEYDTEGRLVKETLLDYSFGESKCVTLYEYNSEGLLSKESVTDDYWTLEYYYEYDEDKRRSVIHRKNVVVNDKLCEDTLEYAYDAQGGYTVKYILEGQPYLIYEIDKNGSIVKEIRYKNGTENIVEHTYDYQYDQDENLTKKITYNDGTIQEILEYEYDDNKNIVSEYNLKFQSEVYYEYDTNGNLIKESWPQSEYIYEYNTEGQLNKQVSEHGQTTYEYDASGKLIKEMGTFEGVSVVTTHEYDTEGKKVRSLSESSAYSAETGYEYDADGNMIRENVIEKYDGATAYSHTREYTYAPLSEE